MHHQELFYLTNIKICSWVYVHKEVIIGKKEKRSTVYEEGKIAIKNCFHF